MVMGGGLAFLVLLSARYAIKTRRQISRNAAVINYIDKIPRRFGFVIRNG